MGIDPGSRLTGWGVIEWRGHQQPTHLAHGVIRLPAHAELPLRLHQLHQELTKLLLKYQPFAVVVEKIFLGRNADSAFKLGHARGVCLQCVAGAEAKAFEYAARKVKLAVTGQGKASKEQVRLHTSRFLGLADALPLDASDALALTLCHIQEMSQRNKIAQAREMELR